MSIIYRPQDTENLEFCLNDIASDPSVLHIKNRELYLLHGVGTKSLTATYKIKGIEKFIIIGIMLHSKALCLYIVFTV